jgi:hypothetical protein
VTRDVATLLVLEITEDRACVLAVKGAAMADTVDLRLLVVDGEVCGGEGGPDEDADEDEGEVVVRVVEAGEGHAEDRGLATRDSRSKSSKSSEEPEHDV